MAMFKALFGGKKPAADRVNLKGRFELVSKMGLGTMSQVWKADDRQRQEMVALKIIDRQMQEKINAKFPREHRPSEGAVAVSLEHPHVVKTYEYGTSTDEEPFLVMEHVDGYGLETLISKRDKNLNKHGLRWMIQIGQALSYFHEQNYIHRDFCPKNILISKQGAVKLIDFGLVVPNTPPFQAPGNRTGTADYMAPELVKRQRTDQRIDVYSYAVTCYEMCCGKLPYPSGKSMETIIRNLNSPPHDLAERNPKLPAELVAVIMKGLEKFPQDRWQSAQEMTNALRELTRKS